MYKRFLILVLLCLTLSSFLCCFATGAGEQTWNATTVDENLPVSLIIYQVDEDTRLPVTGAEYILSQENDTYLSLNARSTNVRWVSSQENATVLVSDEDGVINVDGILPGIYYLTETKAPNGYRLQDEPLKICLSARYATGASGESEISELSVQVNDGEPILSSDANPLLAEITVSNAYGTILPDTGGIGTTIYYMMGMLALFTVALVLGAKYLVRQEA